LSIRHNYLPLFSSEIYCMRRANYLLFQANTQAPWMLRLLVRGKGGFDAKRDNDALTAPL